MKDINSVPMLLRREIEARILVPMIKAYEVELGKDRARAIAAQVIKQDANAAGRFLAKRFGGNTLADFEKTLPLMGEGGAIESEVTERNDWTLCFDVTVCKYAQMYRDLGIEEYGVLLSCGRDASLFEGFNPEVTFKRNNTIMEGGARCDFSLTKEE